MESMPDRILPVSLPRRMVGDFLYAGRQLVLAPIQRRMHLAELVAAQAAACPRPSWCALFVKALAAVWARRPELRRSYAPWPWPRFLEHGQNTITVVIERIYRDEEALFLARLREPENLPISELDALIRSYKDRPIEKISGFVGALRLARLPHPLRRALWWIIMNCCPRTRAKLLGTCGVSVTAGQGAAGLMVIAPWNYTLYYDGFDDHGALDVRITFDHRVIDGCVLARAMVTMEEELLGPILTEVRSLNRAAA
jgi:hypothetical protein